jgi:hypothetical protein
MSENSEMPRKVQSVSCPKCNTPNEHYQTTCFNCGSSLETPAPTSNPSQSSGVFVVTDDNKLAVILALMMVIGVGFIASVCVCPNLG